MSDRPSSSAAATNFHYMPSSAMSDMPSLLRPAPSSSSTTCQIMNIRPLDQQTLQKPPTRVTVEFDDAHEPKTRQHLQYEVIRTFNDSNEYDQWWNHEGGGKGWIFNTIYKKKNDDEVHVYRCGHRHCSQRVRVVFIANSCDVRVEQAIIEHMHDEKPQKLDSIKTLSSTVKTKIALLEALGMTPTNIRRNLSKEPTENNEEVPTLKQIQNYIARIRTKRESPPAAESSSMNGGESTLKRKPGRPKRSAEQATNEQLKGLEQLFTMAAAAASAQQNQQRQQQIQRPQQPAPINDAPRATLTVGAIRELPLNSYQPQVEKLPQLAAVAPPIAQEKPAKRALAPSEPEAESLETSGIDVFQELNKFLLENCSSTKVDIGPPVKRLRLSYHFDRSFASEEEFRAWWDAEGGASMIHNSTYANSAGEKIDIYRCSKRDCRHRMRIVHNETEGTIAVEKAELDHDPAAHEAKNTLTKEAKAQIKELFDLGLKPKAIRTHFMQYTLNSADVPSMLQIKNYVTRLKLEKGNAKSVDAATASMAGTADADDDLSALFNASSNDLSAYLSASGQDAFPDDE